MKKRYIYSLLFGIPGMLVSLVVSFFIFGFVAGFLWLYVYGDALWPAAAGKMLPVLFGVCFLALWAMTLVMGYVTGKRLETTPDLNRRHVLVSAVATVLPLLLIMLHQTRHSGAKTDSQLCSEYCSSRGYSASGMPAKDTGDRSCSCFDAAGGELLKVPLDSVSSAGQE